MRSQRTDCHFTNIQQLLPSIPTTVLFPSTNLNPGFTINDRPCYPLDSSCPPSTPTTVAPWPREAEPLLGDHFSFKALREALEPFQPYQHSPNRFFPSSAVAFGRLMRYVPTLATVYSPPNTHARSPIIVVSRVGHDRMRRMRQTGMW